MCLSFRSSYEILFQPLPSVQDCERQRDDLSDKLDYFYKESKIWINFFLDPFFSFENSVEPNLPLIPANNGEASHFLFAIADSTSDVSQLSANCRAVPPGSVEVCWYWYCSPCGLAQYSHTLESIAPLLSSPVPFVLAGETDHQCSPLFLGVHQGKGRTKSDWPTFGNLLETNHSICFQECWAA